MKSTPWRQPYAILTVICALLVFGQLGFLFLANKSGQVPRLSAGQSGGVYLPLALSIAEICENSGDGLKIEVLESEGSAENAARLRAGEAELALIQNDTPSDDSFRTLVPMHPDVLHFLVAADSGITDLSGITGRRVAIGLPHSGSDHLGRALLNHFEVDLSPPTELMPMTIGEACTRLAAGEIDGLLMVLHLKSQTIEDLISSSRVRMVPIGDDIGPGSEIEGFRLSYPYVEPFLVPRHSYAMPRGNSPGIPTRPVPTVAVRSILAARSDLPDPVARQLTRRIIENRSRITVAGRTISMVGDPDEVERLQFPLHDGAAQYFSRNEPGFFVRYADVLALVFTILAALYGMVRSGRKWFVQRQKNRIDAYYLELNRLLDRMLEPLTDEELREIQRRLQRIRSIALRQLAKERLLPDESFRIFQTVLAEAGAQARYRLQEAKSLRS